MKKRRTIPPALHVIFARPDHLDRNSRSLCDMNSFHHKVGLRRSPPPKSAAQKRRMDLDLFIRQSRNLGRSRTIHRLKLCPRPDPYDVSGRSEEHTSELQSLTN